MNSRALLIAALLVSPVCGAWASAARPLPSLPGPSSARRTKMMAAVPAHGTLVVRAHLRLTATIKGTAIRLGEVARIDGSGPSAASLAAVDLGPSPLPGRSRGVDADYIRIRLRQQRIDPSALAPDSAAACQVMRASQTLSGDAITELARQFLEGTVEAGEGRLVVEPVSHPRDVILPVGDLKLSAGAVGGGIGAGRVVMVQITVDGAPAGQAEVSLRIRRYAQVAVARTALARGDSLTLDRVGYEERDRMSLPPDVILQGESLEDLQALQMIGAGSVITHRFAASPPAIHRGDAVTIRAQIGGIQVTAPGTAMEDGRPGDAIRVRNGAGSAEIHAVVVDAKTVDAPL